MRANHMKKGVSILLVMTVFFTFTLAMTAEVNAATVTRSAKVYSDVIKKGNTVYCATEAGIYKVKLKNKKVVSSKRLVKAYENVIQENMKIKGNYLYYTEIYPIGETLNRINLKTGKDEEIFVPGKGRFKNSDSVQVISYAFKGTKLYAKVYFDNASTYKEYTRTFVSKLNGKSTEKSKVKINFTVKKANVKGFKVDSKYTSDDRYVKAYLRTPKGKYYLGKTKLY